MRQGNLDEGLADYPNASFEYVILSQTLALLDRPQPVVKEMLRVGKQAIISFDNIGYWRRRLQALRGVGSGQALCNGGDRPRAISLNEFHQFVACLGAQIESAAYVTPSRRIKWRPALMSSVAVYTLRTSP